MGSNLTPNNWVVLGLILTMCFALWGDNLPEELKPEKKKKLLKPKPPVQFPCPRCSVTCTWELSLRQHVRLKHGSIAVEELDKKAPSRSRTINHFFASKLSSSSSSSSIRAQYSRFWHPACEARFPFLVAFLWRIAPQAGQNALSAPQAGQKMHKIRL